MFRTIRELQAWANAVSILRDPMVPEVLNTIKHVWAYPVPQDHGVEPFTIRELVLQRFASERPRDPHTRGLLYDSHGAAYFGPNSPFSYWIHYSIRDKVDQIRVSWETLLTEPGALGFCPVARRVYSIHGDLLQRAGVPETDTKLWRLWAHPVKTALTIPIARIIGGCVHAQAVLDTVCG